SQPGGPRSGVRNVFAIACAGALLACGANTAGIGGNGGGKGQGGGSGGSGGGGGGTGAGNEDGCSDSAKIIYVVDANNTFSSFDPMTLTFHDIGMLDCPASAGAKPFSMAVTRDASAYVLYDDGEIFRVNTVGLACTSTMFHASSSFTQFGMGFSTDV